MASSAAVASPPPPKPLAADIDEGDESEYEEIEEEIEVEEEVDIEEEVEIEEEEVEEVDMEVETEDETEPDPGESEAPKQIGENLTPARRLNLENDTNHIMELKEHEEFTHGLHVSNPPMDDKHVGDQRQISPRLLLPQMRPRDPSSSDEFKGENKKLRIACEFYAKGWCIRGSSCRFLHIKDGSDAAKRSEILEKEASSCARIPPQQSWENPNLKSESEKLVLQKDDTFESDRGRFGLNFHLSNYSYYASPLVKDNLTARNSSYHGRFSLTQQRSDPSSGDLLYSHPTQPLYLGSSSWNTNARGAHNFWESGLEHRASVPSSSQRTIPPVSHFVSETVSLNYNSSATGPANYKPTFSSLDWEPSVPFVPSHEITRMLLSKEKLYDPVRDSIDDKDVEDVKRKNSHSDQGSSVKDINVQSDILKEEEKLLNSENAGNIKEDNILTSSGDDKRELDKARDEPVSEGVGFSKKDEVDVSLKLENQTQSESNDSKIFQFALIEFVKELVKPTWREGFLSRDAHKLIVKKAVDKILISIPPDQIPRTTESTDFYLSSCQPKIAKLVEAYINKYGTSQDS